MRKVGVFVMIFWMGVNGDGSGMSGWGMSRASKRAKEHEKRTWEVEIMAKTVLVVIWGRGVRAPAVGGAGARGGPGQTARGCGCVGVSDFGEIFWDMAIFRGFRGGKGRD